jgi:putative ABC transport system permease protein
VLLALMAALALILGAIGVYGVIAQFTARRRHEWAIRIALGQPAAGVITHIVSHGTWLLLAGIVAGFAGAAALTRLLSSFLYGVDALDPLAFAAAGAALLAVGIIAALIPACRAGLADPLIALRDQ